MCQVVISHFPSPNRVQPRSLKRRWSGHRYWIRRRSLGQRESRHQPSIHISSDCKKLAADLMNYWSFAAKGPCPAKHPGTERRWNTWLLRQGDQELDMPSHYFKGAAKNTTLRLRPGQAIGLFTYSLRDVPLKLPCRTSTFEPYS